MYAMIFTDDGPDVIFYHPDTQVFEELMPNEFHRFEYLYYDWENIDSPHGSPFVPGPNPVGKNDAFMGFDSDFTDRGQQLSPVKKSSSGRVNKKRVRFSEDLEAIRIIPNRHELAQMAAENEDKDEDGRNLVQPETKNEQAQGCDPREDPSEDPSRDRD